MDDPPMTRRESRLNLRLSPSDLAKLRKLAHDDERSMSRTVVWLVKAELERRRGRVERTEVVG